MQYWATYSNSLKSIYESVYTDIPLTEDELSIHFDYDESNGKIEVDYNNNLNWSFIILTFVVNKADDDTLLKITHNGCVVFDSTVADFCDLYKNSLEYKMENIPPMMTSESISMMMLEPLVKGKVGFKELLKDSTTLRYVYRYLFGVCVDGINK